MCIRDRSKRKLYDQHGKKGLEEGGGGGGFNDASDIFSMFFGGGRRERSDPKPKDIVHELAISLEDMYNGKTKKIAVTRDRLCTGCNGQGVKTGCVKASCSTCGGQGRVIRIQEPFPGMQQRVQMACPACHGEGKKAKPEDVCGGCNGRAIVKDRKVLEIVVEKGMKKGDHQRFAGEGDQDPNMKINGDVLIFIASKPHDLFRRVGSHLLVNHNITLQQALCGFELPVEHLDGRVLVIKIPAGQCIDPNFAWTVNREGMPLPGTGGVQRGNLVFHFEVAFPDSLTDAQRTAICSALGGSTSFPTVEGGKKVTLKNYVPPKPKRGGGHRDPRMMHMGGDDDDDDDEGGQPGGGQGVQCQQQ
eukprot:TRINITY_DN51515_c0_g1_i1.p1 TRINITY_DN51515_c0_g1~~TRINITY_DN51515_c0_g1_i1.p1  ORF type:complete len:360 (+),score=73.53 TRINITY_DN51515_c0_g1_i1:84-1163(+)